MALAILISGFALEGTILARGMMARLFPKYPFFYFHVLVIFVEQFLAFAIYIWYLPVYPRFYWYGQFLTMVTACSVIVEIIRHALAQPGMVMLRRTAWALLSILIVGIITAYFRAMHMQDIGVTDRLERDSRAAQALLLFGILFVVFYYGLPVGRNIRGMFVGYGLYITSSLITLALMLYGGVSSRSDWNFVQPLACIAELTVWAITLWTYNPNIILEPLPRAGVQYAALRFLPKR
jgi:hypothetical protein